MSMIHTIILAALSVFLLSACSDNKTTTAPDKDSLSNVVGSFGYEVVDTDHDKTYVEMEELDRSFYKPLSVESARIRSLKPLDAYGGPELGNYFLSIEVYSNPEQAQKRAEEYRDLSRLEGATDYDRNDLSKRTVRCWGFSSGERAYLLTTHAAMFSALEEKVHSVIDGVKAHEQQRGEQAGSSNGG
jgi:hypothetical protein